MVGRNGECRLQKGGNGQTAREKMNKGRKEARSKKDQVKRDEIGLIPCPEARYNRSPIVLVENKLGVESWCIKFLLPYVHNRLLLYRQRKQWLNRDELIDITCTLLLLNPDFTTAWNVRKELIQARTLNPVKDLHLGKLALTKFPKSPETWIHRRWVLQQLMREHALPTCRSKGRAVTVPGEGLSGVVQEELQVCSDAAGRYPSNYNAWSHRIWVLQHLGKLDVKTLLNELSSTKHWVAMHISDHSGFHYRQFLLKCLMDKAVTGGSTPLDALPTNEQTRCLPKSEGTHDELQRVNIPLLLEEEMELSMDLIESYPGHETLWCHRRQVFCLLHQLSTECLHAASRPICGASNGNRTLNGSCIGAPALLCHPSQAMDVDSGVDGSRQHYTQEIKRLKRGPEQDYLGVGAEQRFADDILSACRNPEQARLAAAYRKWLVTFLGQ
ncbi:protein prenyltransferase alpha subunit repeat-containing protein 1 isoform X2 [Rhinatrema bivittatum]|uniref:protein prenyltransferase alpha subunit repeat-containing protein 1 isoform X2 n=1 Tax=Rhinatrema bivittatum TaxID=194408 RepID=UPI0011282F9E|nr:protein prenyltransferase alpha subunit repeat-containing protein 1 isoform X2 [Rhinatrema bivittatum]